MQGDEIVRATWYLAHWTVYLTVATFAAVLVALFGERFWRWYTRPIFNIRCMCQKLFVLMGEQQQRVPAYYLRLRVTNAGRTTASHVQVRIQTLERISTSGKDNRQPMPFYLCWTHHGDPAWLARLPSGAEADCDVARIAHPRDRKKIGDDSDLVQTSPASDILDDTCLKFITTVTPSTREDLWAPGTYKVTIQIAAENCPAICRTLKVICGTWHDDQEAMCNSGPGPIISLWD